MGLRLAAAFLIAAVVAIGLSATGLGALSEPAPPEASPVFSDVPADKLACTPADSPTGFSTYALGGDFRGLPLVHVERVCYGPLKGEEVRPNYATFIYGTCKNAEAGDDSAGCAPPLEVQTWSICDRHPSLYETQEGTSLLGPVDDSRRGVPSAVLDRGTRVELFTKDATIVVFSDSSEVAEAAVQQLHPLAPEVAPTLEAAEAAEESGSDPSLPEPSVAAMMGTLTCQ